MVRVGPVVWRGRICASHIGAGQRRGDRRGILLPHVAFGVPFQVFLLMAFFRAIPRGLDEAAGMDGASA